MIIYHLDKFNELRDKKECVLPIDIVNLIKQLTMSIVEVPSHKTYEFNDKFKKKKKIDTIDIPALPKTIINKKSGIEKEIDLTRILLNKLTKNTYSKIYPELVLKFDLLNNTYNNEDCKKLGKAILDILINNNLFSDLSSELLKELIKYEFIYEAIFLKINEFKCNYDDFSEDIDNVLDNEEIYKKNKQIDKNKSLANLLSNLVKNKTINLEIFLDLINRFLDLFFKLINLKNHVKYVEEISDILFILIKDAYIVIKDSNEWENIFNNVEYIINIKVVSRLSLSQRVIFKFMDLKDTVYKLK